MDTETTTNLPTANNNPGDLREAGQANSTPGEGGFASFPNAQDGFGALLNQIQTNINNKPTETLADFSNTYAPPTDGNNSAQYAANLANQLGVSPATPISQLEPDIGKFADAIATNEGYEGNETAASTPTTSSQSSGFNLPDILAGVAGAGLTGLGWLSQYIEKPLTDAAVDAGIGAVTGTAAEPGGGTVAGALAGAGTGVVQGVLQDIEGSGSAPSTPTTSTDTSDSSTATTPGLVSTPTAPPTEPTTITPSEPEIEQLKDFDSLAPQASQASNTVATTQAEALGRLPSGRVMLQQPNIQAGVATNSLFGLGNDVDENGNQVSGEDIKRSNKLIGDVDDTTRQVLETEGKSAGAEQLNPEAESYINKYVPETQRDDARQYVKDTLPKYMKEHGLKKGDKIPLHVWDRIRSQEGHGRKWDTTETNGKRSGAKALSRAARNIVEKNTDHKEFYNEAMKLKHDLIQGQKVLKKLDGKKAPAHSSFTKELAHSVGRYVALSIGDAIGGPAGAIIGDMMGRSIIKAIDKRHGKTIFETPAMQSALGMIQKQNPAAALKLKMELVKAGVRPVDGPVRKGNKNGLSAYYNGPLTKGFKEEQKKGHPGLIKVPMSDTNKSSTKNAQKPLVKVPMNPSTRVGV